MKIIFLLILVSLLIAVGFLSAFLWAVRSGQYDDEYTPSIRMLFDDENENLQNAQSSNGHEKSSPHESDSTI